MYELLEIWYESKRDTKNFLDRVKVFTLPCANILTIIDRTQYAIHWQNEFKKIDDLVQAHGYGILANQDYESYRLMKKFAHHIPEILVLFADTLLPRNFDELVEYFFSDI